MLPRKKKLDALWCHFWAIKMVMKPWLFGCLAVYNTDFLRYMGTVSDCAVHMNQTIRCEKRIPVLFTVNYCRCYIGMPAYNSI